MDILTDLRVLRHNAETARERLTKYLEVENSLPKLWVLRSSQFYFDRTYIRAKKYGKYFSDDSVEVLKECLNLDEEDSLKLIDRGFLRVIQPRVLRYKISKFKEIGLSVEDFKKFPSIFTKCESVIEKRTNILKEHGLFEKKKGTLLYSDNNFNIILERNIQLEKRKLK
ncbi:hypothetical protein Avbf_13872 [Armadillidium vulgare]|nr:hypothetical protein Avbf_13872 [Armadillidium vulgare]